MSHSKKTEVKCFPRVKQNIWVQSSDSNQIFCFIRRKITVQFSSNEATRLDTVSILYSNIVLHWQKRVEVKCFLRIKQNIWVESGDFIQTVRFIRRKDFSSVFCEWNKIFEYNPISLLKYFPPLEGKISLEFPSNETTYLDAIVLIYWNILFHSKKTEVKSSRRLKEYRWI